MYLLIHMYSIPLSFSLKVLFELYYCVKCNCFWLCVNFFWYYTEWCHFKWYGVLWFSRLSVSSSDRRTMSFERKWKRIIISGIKTWNIWGNVFPFLSHLTGLCVASAGAQTLLSVRSNRTHCEICSIFPTSIFIPLIFLFFF